MKRLALSLAAASVIAAVPAVATAQSNAAGTVVVQPERDGVRFRGGLSLGGGPFVPWGLSNISVVGGLGSFHARFGVQFFHAFGVYVQSMNALGAIAIAKDTGELTGIVTAQSFNSLLLSLTIGHVLEFAVGPSFDYMGFFGCSSSPACGSGEGWGLGAHGRASVNLGGLIARGPRRNAFNVGLDLHPMFFLQHGGGLFAASFTIGVEWY